MVALLSTASFKGKGLSSSPSPLGPSSLSPGFVDFGGPLPDVVYRCFEWETCEIEALDGASLSCLAPVAGWR